MPAFILSQIFQRVQITKSECAVLQAILSKANVFGQHAKIAYPCIAAIAGITEGHAKRVVRTLEQEKHLLAVERRVLWPGHNAINVYTVARPWWRELSYREAWEKRRKQIRVNDKGGTSGPPPTTEREKPSATPCTEAEASRWHTPGSLTWYLAQGREPPSDFVPVAN